MAWICTRCSNDEKVDLAELSDGRVRPFCRRCRPKDVKPPMLYADSKGDVYGKSMIEKAVGLWQQRAIINNRNWAESVAVPTASKLLKCKECDAAFPDTDSHWGVGDDTTCTKCRPLPAVVGQPSPFKVGIGTWGRSVATGKLCLVVMTGTGVSGGCIEYMHGDPHLRAIGPTSDLEPALPCAGEWWGKRACAQDGSPDHITGVWSLPASGGVQFQIADNDGYYDREARCGCLVPVNFGRGEA